MVKVTESKMRAIYCLTFRFTKRNFPKTITPSQYKTRLCRKLQIPKKYRVWDVSDWMGRYQFHISDVPEREMRRICKRAKDIDDGILREIRKDVTRHEATYI